MEGHGIVAESWRRFFGGLWRRARSGNSVGSRGKGANRRAAWSFSGRGTLAGSRGSRCCRIEPLERRELLSLQPHPITLGVVYFEPAAGQDQLPNVFHVSFTGGAPGTRLVELVIDTDKLGDGLTIGDALFDIAPEGDHAFGFSPFHVVKAEGIDRVRAEVVDGGTTLRLQFEGFEAGDLLIFTIDVDEMGFLGPNAVVEGNEFEGSILWVRLEAPHYFAAEGTTRFFDAYEFPLSLPLPPDDYVPPSDVPLPVHTAGAVIALDQIPLPAALEGIVFEDLNLDGQRSPSEPPIPGVIVELWRLEQGSYTPTGLQSLTGSDGRFVFENLLPGVYRLVQHQPAGYFSVAASVGQIEGVRQGQEAGPNDIRGIELFGGQRGVGYEFAEARPVSLQGGVYHDRNDNGLWDAGEEGIPHAVLLAEYWGPLTGEDIVREFRVVTDENGLFLFENLPPGWWSLTEVQPVGYLDGKDQLGDSGGVLEDGSDKVTDIFLPSGGSGSGYLFGELLPVTISGHVFADLDGDCRFGLMDYPLAGVVIWLLDAQGHRLVSTITDAAGRYQFQSLWPGVYGIEEIQPAGYFDGGVCLGSAGGQIAGVDRVTGIVLPSGTVAQGYDFPEWPPGSISGFVYEDNNENGQRDANEPGIPGVRLLLLDEAGNFTGKEVVTDQKGAYRFEGLMPLRVYGIQEIQPEGYFDGQDSAGNGGGQVDSESDRITGIWLLPGRHLQGYDFGELRPVSLAGWVIADRNGNCRLDPDEQPLAGVTIWLEGAGGVRLASTVTDAQGRWQFQGLPPGVYAVVEVQPEGYFDGPDCVGTAGGWIEGNDRIAGIKLAPGAHGDNYVFTEWEPARLSGYVFQDGPPLMVIPGESLTPLAAGRTGLRGPQAIPLPGVTLRLMRENGEPIRDSTGREVIAVTDANGYYEFSGLPPGTYCIYQVHPAGFVDWLDSPGTHGGIAVNPGENVDSALLASLVTDPQNDAILAITLRPGDNAREYNFSELRTSPRILLPADPPRREPILTSSPNFWPAEFLRRPRPLGSQTEMSIRLGPGAGLMGSGGPVEETWSWHLSVINGGTPRQTPPARPVIHEVANRLSPAMWGQWRLDQGLWIVVDILSSEVLLQTHFGNADGLPVVGDFNGDGRAQLALFLDGLWFVDLNGNGKWDEGDLWLQLGQAGDRPVTGDWDGDSKTDVGIFGPPWPEDSRMVLLEPGLPDVANRRQGIPKNLPPEDATRMGHSRLMRLTSHGSLRADVIDHVFFFGGKGAIPVTGDWNGDGVTNIGIFYDGRWILDVDGDGRLTAADLVIESFGQPGDWPVVGDWNGDGIHDLGVWRQGIFYLDSDGDRRLTAHDKALALGEPGDIPVAGDFNGDGRTDVGVYRPAGRPSGKFARDIPPGPSGPAY